MKRLSNSVDLGYFITDSARTINKNLKYSNPIKRLSKVQCTKIELKLKEKKDDVHLAIVGNRLYWKLTDTFPIHYRNIKVDFYFTIDEKFAFMTKTGSITKIAVYNRSLLAEEVYVPKYIRRETWLTS